MFSCALLTACRSSFSIPSEVFDTWDDFGTRLEPKRVETFDFSVDFDSGLCWGSVAGSACSALVPDCSWENCLLKLFVHFPD